MMPGLTRAEIDRFKRRLTQRREELVRIIRDGLIETRQSDYVNLAAQVHDAGEESVADLLTDLNVSRLTRETEELRDIEAALTRMRDGSYGTCVDCGGIVGAARLDAHPTAKRCADCQARHEKRRRGGRDVTPSL